MDFSDFVYVYYVGPDAWGPGTSADHHDQLCSEFEARIQERFPGINIFHTLDPYLTGVTGNPELTAQGAAEETQMHEDIKQIAERVLAGEPEL